MDCSRPNAGTRLDVETLIHLGGIDDFYIENLGTGGTTLAAEHWSIRANAKSSVPDEQLSYDRVYAEARVDKETDELRCFDRFEHLGAPDTQVRLLVDRTPELPTLADQVELPLSGDPSDSTVIPEREIEYPIHLYYPIDSTREGRYPFCLHGRFRVSTNRRDFSEDTQNRRVLEQGGDLIRRVSEACAAKTSEASSWWDLYPWLLLPPAPSDEAPPAEPIETPALLAYLKHEAYKQLGAARCIPTDTGPRVPDAVFIGDSGDIRRGVAAAVSVREEVPTDDVATGTSEPDADVLSLPSKGTLSAINETLDGACDWDSRVTALTGDLSPETLLDNWLDWLNHHLATEQPGERALTVRTADARDLFRGTVRTLEQYREASDSSMQTILQREWIAQRLNRVYLLPCQDLAEDRLQLVATESRLQMDDTKTRTRGRRSSRTVIWDYSSSSGTTQFPPEYGSFAVHFLDSESSEGIAHGVLASAGQAWGVRRGSSPAELYKSLLEPIPHTDDSRVDGAKLSGLAELVTCYNEEKATTLDTGELAFLDTEHLLRKVHRGGKDRRDERLRTNLRTATLDLDDERACVADIALSPAWAQLRERARDQGQRTDTEAHSQTDARTTDQQFGGASDFWLPAPGSKTLKRTIPGLGRTTDEGSVARVLSLLGASRLPGLRFCWLLDRRHHPDPDLWHDDSADSGSNPPWWPADWDTEKIPTDDGKQQHASLVTALADQTGYRDWLGSAAGRPSHTISHNQTCDGMPVSRVGGDGSYISAWVWFTRPGLDWMSLHPKLVINALTDHPEPYRAGLLNTYWHCQDFQRCNYRSDQYVPTLANWQLRGLPIWDELLELSDKVASSGADWKTTTLHEAVLKGSSQARGWQLFPHVDGDADGVPDTEVLQDMGVRALDELNASQAATKLQLVQEAFAADSDGLDSEQPVPLDFPNQSYWNGARIKLLKPIFEHVASGSVGGSWENATALPMLTHLPVRKGASWYSAPITWIESDSRRAEVKYLPATPTPWQKRALAGTPEEPIYELYREESGEFATFAEALGVDLIDARDPVLNITEVEERECTVPGLAGRLEEIRRAVRDRLDLLIAVQELSARDSIKDRREELNRAIEGLRVVGSLPEWVTDPLPRTGSAIYKDGDNKGLLLNIAGIRDLSSAQELAEMAWGAVVDRGILEELGMGLALTAENYRAREHLESVLDLRDDRATLIDRLKKDTFPVDAVRSHFATDIEHAVTQRVRASNALVERLGLEFSLPSRETIQQAIDEDELGMEQPSEGLESTFGVESLDTAPDSVREYIRSIRALPARFQHLIEALYRQEPAYDWREKFSEFEADEREAVIRWWVENERLLPTALTEAIERRQATRLLTVRQVGLANTAPPDTPSGWKTALDEATDSFEWSDTVPPELRQEGETATRWIELDVTDLEMSISTMLNALRERQSVDEQLIDELRTYITGGTMTVKSTQEHRANSLARAAEVMNSAEQDFSIGDSTPDTRNDDDEGAVTERGNETNSCVSTGGGSGSFKGRGEDAEIATAILILDHLTDWVEADTQQNFEALIEELQDLRDDEPPKKQYRWHRADAWQELRPLLETDQPLETIESKYLNWRADLRTGELETAPLFRLLDVSQEDGPGFDMIDPLGPIGTATTGTERELAPSPIEIKAVEDTPPYSFRLTTNEYQQCLNFLEAGRNYVLRLVYVPDSKERVAKADLRKEIVLKNKGDLRNLIPLEQFERNVVGGKIDMRVE